MAQTRAGIQKANRHDTEEPWHNAEHGVGLIAEWMVSRGVGMSAAAAVCTPYTASFGNIPLLISLRFLSRDKSDKKGNEHQRAYVVATVVSPANSS